MGCNCKENTEKVSKYTDDGKPIFKPMSRMKKVWNSILRVFLGILVFVLVIISLPFAVIYVSISAIFGKGVRINLKKLSRLNVKQG